MSIYNYNEGKNYRQRKAIRLFKTWFDSEGLCQFSYRCNRGRNYFVKYRVYTNTEGCSTLEENIDEMQGGSWSGKVSRKALQDIQVDFYIDIVCVHKGTPRFGFMVIDGDIHPDEIERLRAVRHNNCFELYTVEAAWILAQTNKPDSIDCEYIMGQNPG